MLLLSGEDPAGSSSAYFNAKQGKRVLFIEKQTFPRDKICGDGVTGKALSILHEMELTEEITKIKEISSNGVVIYAPNKDNLRISIASPNDPFSAFSIDRMILDEMIYNKAKDMVLENGGEILNDKVLEPIVEDNKIVGVKTKNENYYSKLVVGAGGYNCPISRFVLEKNNIVKQDRNHYSSAIREYWDGIEGNEGDFEIHFIEGILPRLFLDIPNI